MTYTVSSGTLNSHRRHFRYIDCRFTAVKMVGYQSYTAIVTPVSANIRHFVYSCTVSRRDFRPIVEGK